MNQIIKLSALLALFLLPGCGGTLVDLAKENLTQGKEYKSYQKKTKHYIRKISMYDQFNTVGLFDALWLSDEMRTMYANVNADMHGKAIDVKHAFLRRQLKENNHFLSFYVLSTHNNPLSVKPVPWAMHLQIDGKKYTPFEVKAVELVPEYKMFFGSLYNKHKTAYEVRFERNDANGADILKEGNPHSMKLYFSNPSYFACATWNVDTIGKSIAVRGRPPLPPSVKSKGSKKHKKRKR